jgi:predicted phage tail component-like protein
MAINLLRSFTFNGTDKPDWLLINKTHRPLTPKLEGTFLKVPKRAGAYYFGKSTDMRNIAFDFTIMADSQQDLWKKAEWLTNWLITEEPAELVINDEPDRIYYALLMDETELNDIAAMGAGTINFVCPDPFKYGSEYTQDLTANPTILNDGNAEIFPIIEATFTENATHFAIVTEDKTFLVGKPEDVESTRAERYQLINSYDMSSTVGWTSTGTIVDNNATVAGTMAAQEGTFRANNRTDYGAQNAGWHGPALKTSLSEPLDDFKIDAFGTLAATKIQQVGRIELYLLDVNGAVVAKGVIKDMHKDYENNWGEVRAGPYNDADYIINTYYKTGVWNNFNGKISIERNGPKWKASVGKYNFDKQRYEYVKTNFYWSTEANKMADIAQIQVAVMANYSYEPVTYASWDWIRVYKINPLTEETNILFKPGDVLTIDNSRKAVFINGVPRLDVMAWDSEFISLKPGENNLAISPPTGVTVTATYRKRWK